MGLTAIDARLEELARQYVGRMSTSPIPQSETRNPRSAICYDPADCCSRRARISTTKIDSTWIGGGTFSAKCGDPLAA